MPLRITLAPGERIVVNGCAIRGGARRQVLTFEDRADVLRGRDMLDAAEADTPVRRAHFLVQTALTRRELRADLEPLIRRALADLATVFAGDAVGHVFAAARAVGDDDLYAALASLRPLRAREARHFEAAGRTA